MSAQLRMAFEVSSVPLSPTIVFGRPCWRITSFSSRATRRPEIEVSATSARHSRVQSSTTARMRKRRPSVSWSATWRAAPFLPSSATPCWSAAPRLRHEAHLATSLKDKGALIGVFWLRAARESRAGIEPGQLGRGDRPACALADLPRPDDAAADQPEHRHLADGETPRRLCQGQLAALGHLAIPVHGNAVGAAVRAHPAFDPAVALAGTLAAAI